jgi:hypothetical protein
VLLLLRLALLNAAAVFAFIPSEEHPMFCCKAVFMLNTTAAAATASIAAI